MSRRNNLGFVIPDIGGVITDIGNLFSGIFGSNHDDEIVNQLSQIQSQYGFNLTHDQIIHLLPADWGNPDNWNRTATVFINQLQNLASWLTAGNSAATFNGWGGNFKPGAVSYSAAIPTFTPPPVTPGGGSGGSGSSQPKQAGLFDNPLILLGLVGIAFAMFSGKSKRRR